MQEDGISILSHDVHDQKKKNTKGRAINPSLNYVATKDCSIVTVKARMTSQANFVLGVFQYFEILIFAYFQMQKQDRWTHAYIRDRYTSFYLILIRVILDFKLICSEISVVKNYS